MSCTRGRDKLVAGVAFSSVDQLRFLGYRERGSLIDFRYMTTYFGTMKIVKPRIESNPSENSVL